MSMYINSKYDTQRDKLNSSGLSDKQTKFVIEYLKDFSARRAAQAAGYSADDGYKLRDDASISNAIDKQLDEQLRKINVDANWLLAELVDNHHIARSQGKIAASNAALTIIAKHVSVDAFAAAKIDLTDNRQLLERLTRARCRGVSAALDEQASLMDGNVDDYIGDVAVSFM